MTDFIWNIISCLTKNRLINHQKESYVLFLEKYIPDIVEEYSKIKTDKYLILFENVQYGIPSYINNANQTIVQSPFLCMQEHLNYCLPMYIDIKINDSIFPKQFVASLPVMVGSKYCTSNDSIIKKKSDECPIDPGGYFIVKGNEKVILCQERMIDNKCFFSYKKDQKYSYSISVRSNITLTQMSNVLTVLSDKQYFRISFINLKNNIPLFVLFHLCGAKTDRAILSYIGDQYLKILQPSFNEYHEIKNRHISIEQYLISQFSNEKFQINFLIESRILPHLHNNKEKLFFLGYMTRQLIKYISNEEVFEVIDRDSLHNKKIETSGTLLGQLFRKLWRDSINWLKYCISRDKHWTPYHQKILKTNIITNKILTSLKTGNWDSKISSENKKYGIAQILKRLNYKAILSHLRRINSPVNKSGKLIKPRKLHNSQFGYCCSAESPEGHQIGLIKHLALTAIISSYGISDIVLFYLKENKNFQSINNNFLNSFSIFIFVNGVIVGETQHPMKIVNYLRNKRRNGKLLYSISVTYFSQDNAIHIFTDEGRLLRPLFIVKKNKLNLDVIKWKRRIKNNDFVLLDLLQNGIIEFLDTNEIQTTLIAKNIDDLKKNEKNKLLTYSHCEIHNCLIFGTSAVGIPFANHNQAPRVLYQCAQVQQAIGFNNLNILRRMDTVSHMLHYMQKPIVTTKASKLLGIGEWSSGSNLIVAICCHEGFNIEDSVIYNRGSIERGSFHVTTFRTYKTSLSKSAIASNEKIGIPDPTECIQVRKKSLYNLLDKNGIIRVGTIVKENDILIGKMCPIPPQQQQQQQSGLKYRDTSIQLKESISGVVDKISIINTINDEMIIKIKIRTFRVPELGDKCCSRHGQKGTIGIVLDETEMPFTESGIVPDLIINPHCLPTLF